MTALLESPVPDKHACASWRGCSRAGTQLAAAGWAGQNETLLDDYSLNARHRISDSPKLTNVLVLQGESEAGPGPSSQRQAGQGWVHMDSSKHRDN